MFNNDFDDLLRHEWAERHLDLPDKLEKLKEVFSKWATGRQKVQQRVKENLQQKLEFLMKRYRMMII